VRDAAAAVGNPEIDISFFNLTRAGICSVVELSLKILCKICMKKM
jgi:hypothetical protein